MVFYEPGVEGERGEHGLPHDPLKACVMPRPIGWVTTMDADGKPNLAPYSFYNMITASPPLVQFTSNHHKPTKERKDSLANVVATGEFVVNVPSEAHRYVVNASACPLPAGYGEVDFVNKHCQGVCGTDEPLPDCHLDLAFVPSKLVKPPRVASAMIHLECKLEKIVELPSNHVGGKNVMVIGRIIGVDINDNVLVDGLIDVGKVRPLARLGYREYGFITADTAFVAPPPPPVPEGYEPPSTPAGVTKVEKKEDKASDDDAKDSAKD